MKKTTIVAVLAACAVVLSVAIGVLKMRESRDMWILENVEALASGEGGECTGPKVMHWLMLFCECTNDQPCSDNYNCESL